MKNLTKVALAGSIVLGVALFSIGCGGSSSCCGNDPIDNPPVAKIANLSANTTNTSAADVNTLALNGAVSTDDKGVTKYAWVEVTCAQNFEDGAIVSTNPTYTVQNLPITPEAKKVCLRVTDANGKTSTTCSCVNKEAPVVTPQCDAPTANLNTTDIDGNLLTTIERSVNDEKVPLKQYNLNCAASASNCAVHSDNNLTCTWAASSYLVEGTDCNVPESQRTAYISDCFSSEPTGRGNDDYGLTQTTPINNTFFKVCSAGSDRYKCIKIDLTVTDNMESNTKSTSTSKIYNVQ